MIRDGVILKEMANREDNLYSNPILVDNKINSRLNSKLNLSKDTNTPKEVLLVLVTS